MAVYLLPVIVLLFVPSLISPPTIASPKNKDSKQDTDDNADSHSIKEIIEIKGSNHSVNEKHSSMVFFPGYVHTDFNNKDNHLVLRILMTKLFSLAIL